LLAAALGGCSFFGYFEDPPCDSEADCSGQGADGDADADADGDADVPPEDFTGVYALQVRNEENGCQLEQWEEDALSNVEVGISQVDDEVTVQVLGLAGTLLNLSVGTDTLVGNEVEATAVGRQETLEGNTCSFRRQGQILGTLVGDTLTGQILYTFRITSGEGTCGYRETCTSSQTFNGSRP
jgi:hypothetical protein